MASATTLQAATQAVQRDAAGDAANAIIFYEQAAEGLAADCTAVGQGPEVDAMRAKSDEYLARARVLRAQSASLPVAPDGGAPAGGGVDPNAVTGALAAGQQAQATLAAAEKKGGWQMYAGAAGAGALGGAMVIGSVIGAPIMVGLLLFSPASPHLLDERLVRHPQARGQLIRLLSLLLILRVAAGRDGRGGCSRVCNDAGGWHGRGGTDCRHRDVERCGQGTRGQCRVPALINLN